MGNQSQKEYPDQDKFFETFPKDYKYLGQVTNARYGQGKVYANQNFSVFEKEIWLPAQNAVETLKAWQTGFNTYKSLKQENIVRYLSHSVSQPNPLCGSKQQVVYIYFEYMPQSVLDDLNNRIQKQRNYKEVHLWYLLYSVIQAGAYLNNRNQYIGDIGLAQILINESAQIKVLPSGALANDLSLIQRFLEQKIKYIDPSIVALLENQTELLLLHVNKNDVFALGVTILELMQLNPLPEKLLVDINTQQQILDYASSLYSKQLISLVKSFLLPLKQRPTFPEIYKQLSTYHKQILSFQPFTIGRPGIQMQPPPKQFQQPILNSYQSPAQTLGRSISNSIPKFYPYSPQIQQSYNFNSVPQVYPNFSPQRIPEFQPQMIGSMVTLIKNKILNIAQLLMELAQPSKKFYQIRV